MRVCVSGRSGGGEIGARGDSLSVFPTHQKSKVLALVDASNQCSFRFNKGFFASFFFAVAFVVVASTRRLRLARRLRPVTVVVADDFLGEGCRASWSHTHAAQHLDAQSINRSLDRPKSINMQHI